VQHDPRTAGVEDGEQFGAKADDERLALGAGAVAGQGLDESDAREAGDGVKTIHHAVDIDAGTPAVWEALTTRAGLGGLAEPPG
jgi:hypothetical protein